MNPHKRNRSHQTPMGSDVRPGRHWYYRWFAIAILATLPSALSTRAIADAKRYPDAATHPGTAASAITDARRTLPAKPAIVPVEPLDAIAQSSSDDLPELMPGTTPDDSRSPTPTSPATTEPVDPRFPTVRMGDRATPLRLPSSFPYILGTGDVIDLDVFDVPEFSEVEYIIGVDGTINLPWVGSVYLEGLTFEGAGNYLEEVYSVYLNDPLIVVRLVNPRPLRISVVGEVNRPGSYTIDPVAGVPGDLGGDGISQWTTAIQAIQQAGSLTQMADIRNIEIQRGQILPGEESIISVDLWEFLQTGSLAQDITLRDGDTVLVPTAPELPPEEILEVAAANFSPEFITTYVVGEVENPGMLDLPPNATLNQALLAAGGYANDRAGRVELIRVNQDGSVERRRVSADFDNPVNEETNPPLRNNDILFVRRSTLAGVVDIIDLVTGPIRNIFGVFDGALDVIERLDPDDDLDDDDDNDEDGDGIDDEDEENFGVGQEPEELAD